ncbi:hypothetical protein [Methylobacterium oryzihabitans]|uniref:Uncharacterized protein n=1 Tax=Methylobacterium oryzihabitans TaxID=2499852 RepID=A0A437NRL2_9HYPH|nr:hypothetical protein [Methylobacterium oryzihabitans]RVU12577.1 hypothetical protein EOE48_27580 [Methylobacterium oryzihabitans]
MRRPTIRWTSAPDEGDAAAAVAEIEAWRAAQGPGPDFAPVLDRLRRGVAELLALPRLREDAVARGLLRDLAAAPDPAALDAALAALLERAGTLASARGPVPAGGPVGDRAAPEPEPPRPPEAFVRPAALPPRRAPRTIIRL